jgi:perosamine synthetase
MKLIPYGKQSIDEDDIKAVVQVLQSDWLTTGPKVEEFEDAFAHFVGAKYAIAMSSGTAALHGATHAIEIGTQDEVLLPPMTFVATANSVVFQGGTPIFVDVEKDTLLIDTSLIEEKISKKTKALIAVDYAGQPCDYDALKNIADRHGLFLIADACHALGAEYKKSKVGSIADLNVFSFHPVKHITTGEGGMVTTNNETLAKRIRTFRNHGINIDHRERMMKQTWFYEVTDLGYNYRLTDLQCALGISQLKKLPDWLNRRQEIARHYDMAFSNTKKIGPLLLKKGISHAYHLYVVRLNSAEIGKDREVVFNELRERGIGVNVHYIPVHLHPYYRERFHVGHGLCPVAESMYEQILSLPIFHGMSDEDIDRVIIAVKEIIEKE